MPERPEQSRVTLIGDIVESKSHPDRARLHRDLREAHALVNRHVRPVQPLYVTAGDEFQAVYAGIADAALASMLLRLQLLGCDEPADTRYGLGIGDFTVFEGGGPMTEQDGPGWWAARDAIELVKQLERKSRSGSPHTWVRRWEGDDAQVDTSNAFFMTRDALVDGLSARQCRLVVDLILGSTAAAAAAKEGISPSAAAQTLKTAGAYALVDAQQLLNRRGA
jgi:hypothetical protein